MREDWSSSILKMSAIFIELILKTLVIVCVIVTKQTLAPRGETFMVEFVIFGKGASTT